MGQVEFQQYAGVRVQDIIFLDVYVGTEHSHITEIYLFLRILDSPVKISPQYNALHSDRQAGSYVQIIHAPNHLVKNPVSLKADSHGYCCTSINYTPEPIIHSFTRLSPVRYLPFPHTPFNLVLPSPNHSHPVHHPINHPIHHPIYHPIYHLNPHPIPHPVPHSIPYLILTLSITLTHA
jgi:hypothetical protein